MSVKTEIMYKQPFLRYIFPIVVRKSWSFQEFLIERASEQLFESCYSMYGKTAKRIW